MGNQTEPGLGPFEEKALLLLGADRDRKGSLDHPADRALDPGE